MEKAPWHVLGFFVCLKWLNLQTTINEMDFSHFPYGLPIDYLNTKNARKIGKQMGEVFVIDNPSKGNYLNKNYIRIRLNIDITAPLSTSFYILRKHKSPVRAFIKYKKLKYTIIVIEDLGMIKKIYHFIKIGDHQNPLKVKYGVGLRIPLQRNFPNWFRNQSP